MDRKILEEQYEFIQDYKKAQNAATGSKYDANSNVTNKNIATMSWEVPKKNIIELNRYMMTKELEKLYGKELAFLGASLVPPIFSNPSIKKG